MAQKIIMATKIIKKVIIPKVVLPKANNHQNNEQNNNSNNGNNGEEQEVYALMERRDETQIMESIRGNFLEEYVYQFGAKDGKQVTGLSWVGTQEAAREYGGIQVQIDKTKEVETKTHFIVTVEAVDTRTGSSRLGRSKQPKMLKLRSGAVIEDEFADVKALSKAQRNAIRSLLPQTWLKEFIKQKLAQKGRVVPGNQVPQPRTGEFQTSRVEEAQTRNSVCSNCRQEITPAEASYSLQNFGFELCRQCQAQQKR
jgi:hypothetical protein